MDTMRNVDAVAGLIDTLVAGVGAEQLDDPTPCTEWSVRHLLNHLVGGGYLFAMAANGDPLGDLAPDETPDLLGDDPAAAWAGSCATVLRAFHAPGAFDRTWNLPFASVPGEIGAQIAFSDLLIHGWDLATATHQPYAPPPELLTHADGVLRMIIGSDRDSHSFGPAVAVDDDAPLLDRMVAVTGRDPAWASVVA
ncbi:MAG: TIGR03086 family metal-binding protein [Acidimicrobiales bacterium]